MSRRLIKTMALLIALVLTVSGLSACSNTGQSLEIRMDVTQGVKNIDPQFATDPLGCTILANTMEGLLRATPDGKLEPAGAQSYTVEDNGLRYIFKLRRDGRWSNGDAVTAHDYVFAFRRLFNSQVPSPYAEQYMVIVNAPLVLSGDLPAVVLGVRAADDYTLEINLSQSTPTFLERLSYTAATPCNEKFFGETRARYGLGTEYLIFNGPYYVKTWNNEKSIALRPNDYYRSPPLCPGVVLYTKRIVAPDEAEGLTKARTALDLFLEGRNDVYPASAQELERLMVAGGTRLEIPNRVWQLVFNTRGPILGQEVIRRALVMSLDSRQYLSRVPDMYHSVESLIPASARLEGLLLPNLLPHNLQWARDAAVEGFAALPQDAGEQQLSLLISEESGLTALGSYMQKQWKDVLSLYVNMEILPEVELQKRLEAGSYTLALQMVQATGQDPGSVLVNFSALGTPNVTGWQSPEFDSMLEEAVQSGSRQAAARLYEDAEQAVLDAAVALPVLAQSSYFAFGNGVSGVQVVAGRLDFRNAVRIPA